MSRSIRAHDLENSKYARLLAPEDLAAAVRRPRRGASGLIVVRERRIMSDTFMGISFEHAGDYAATPPNPIVPKTSWRREIAPG
jgi:hypothetical protein